MKNKALLMAIIFIVLIIFSVIGFCCKAQITGSYFIIDFEGEILPTIPSRQIARDSTRQAAGDSVEAIWVRNDNDRKIYEFREI